MKVFTFRRSQAECSIVSKLKYHKDRVSWHAAGLRGIKIEKVFLNCSGTVYRTILAFS